MSKKKNNKIKIQLVRSVIGYNDNIKSTIRGLGLRKLNSVSELDDTKSVQGMVSKVSHLIKVINN